MRELLEFQAGGAGRRIFVVGIQIAPPQLCRIHADLRRRKLHQTLGDRSRDRVADRAVLAHHVLVLKHHAGAGAVVRARIGAADQAYDLIGLDAAGARIDRVGADAGQVVDLERGDGAVIFHADLRLDAVIAGVNVGRKTFEAVGDKLDRALEQFRQRHRRHLVGVDVHLDAERAADVLGQHPHLVLFQTQMLGEDVLRHVRRLRALIHGEALLAGIPVGDDGARLVGDAGMAAEHEGRVDHRIGLGKTFVGVAGIERALEGEVVTERGMDHGRCRIERSFGVGDGGKNLVIDIDKGAGVFGLRARARDHGAHRLALPAGALHRDGVLRRRFDALEVREHADPRRDHLGKLGAGDDRDDARRLLRRRCVHVFDARMGVRRAHERNMHHARQHHVADILAAPRGQPRQIGSRHRAADIGIRPVER